MKALTYLVLAVGLLWSAFWFYGANAERQQIEAWIQETAQSDHPITVANIKTRGFPNRFDTTLSDVQRAGQVGWRFPFLQLLRLSYRSDHLIVAFPDMWEIDTATARFVINAQNARASFRQDSSRFKDIIFEADQISIESTDVPGFNLSDIVFALRPAPVSGSRWDIAISAMVPATTSDETRGRITLRGQATFDRQVTVSAVFDPSLVVQSIRLTELAFERGEDQMLFSGEASIDQVGSVDGVFTGTFGSSDTLTRFLGFAAPDKDFAEVLTNNDILTLTFPVVQGRVELDGTLLSRLPKLR